MAFGPVKITMDGYLPISGGHVPRKLHRFYFAQPRACGWIALDFG